MRKALGAGGLARCGRGRGERHRISPRPTTRSTGRPISNGSARCSQSTAQIVYKPTDAPREIRRRIIRRAILALATEGRGAELRGRELDQVLAALRDRPTGRRFAECSASAGRSGASQARQRVVRRASFSRGWRGRRVGARPRRARPASRRRSGFRPRSSRGSPDETSTVAVRLRGGEGGIEHRPVRSASSRVVLRDDDEIGGARLRDQQVRARRLVGDEGAGWKVATAPIRSGRAAAVRNEIGPLMQ